MKKRYKITAFFLLGIGSFLFFFYLTFPFVIVKEFIQKNVYQATGYSLQIDTLSGKFPFGVKAVGIQIAGAGEKKAELGKASVQIGLLPLLLGNASITVELQDKKKGELSIFVRLSLWDLLQAKKVLLPTLIEITADQFQLDEYINLILSDLAKSPTMDYLIKPVFEIFTMSGKLQAEVDLSINSSDFSKSEGMADIQIQHGGLQISDASLHIPNQSFKKALIKASLKNGQLKIDKSSGLNSEDLALDIQGSVTQKPAMEQSILALELDVELKSKLQDQFGWVLDAAAKKETHGRMKIGIAGTLQHPIYNTL